MPKIETMLPGFANVLAQQVDEDTLLLAVDHPNLWDVGKEPILCVRRSEYDSDQEFLQECIQWARRHGGIPTGAAP